MTVFFFVSSRLPLMQAKRGVKKGQSRKVEKILGPVHHNYYERQGRLAANMAINAFLTSMGLTRALIPQVHRMTGIPETNLRRWQRMIANGSEWRPWHTYHGCHRRISTPLEETVIVLFIKTSFLDQRLIFTDNDFREIPMATFLQARAHFEEIPPFQCSPGFIAAFKARHRLSSRKLHYKRRPAVTEEQRVHWMTTICELMKTVEPSQIVNCDEISWLLHPRGIFTWAEMGCQTVHAHITGDEKDCITVVASVISRGQKLSLAFTASGKTPRVEDS
jgi:hypothetical protein